MSCGRLADPDRRLGELCGTLGLPFDPGYRERWRDYDKLTGDSAGPSRGFPKRDIAPMPALPLADGARRALERDRNYRDGLALLGYAERGP